MRGMRCAVAGLTMGLALTLAVPSQAAATRTVYFENAGTATTSQCNPSYILTARIPHGRPCGHVTVGYDGTGYQPNGSDLYNAVRNATGFRVDARRPLTGTVYIGGYPLISAGSTVAGQWVGTPNTVGGPASATITILINNVVVGTVKGAGVAAPNATVAIPLNLTLPHVLDHKVVRTLDAVVKLTGGAGVAAVSYAPTSRSRIVIPTR